MPGGRLWASAAMLVVGLVMLAVALAPTGQGVRALTNCDVTSEQLALDGSEEEFLRILNEYRVANGVAPLALSENLTRAAAWYAKDMDEKKYFNHDHSDSLGRTPTQRFPDCGYAYGTRGENILAGTTSPSFAFQLWKDSPGHNANMLRSSFKAVGVGRSGVYWVTTFGGTDDSGQPPANTATPTPTKTPTSTPPPTTPSPTNTPGPTNTPTPVPPTSTPRGTTAPTSTPTPTATPTPTGAPESSTYDYGISVPGVRK